MREVVCAHVFYLTCTPAFSEGDAILLQTSTGKWVKFALTEYSYDTHFVSGAGQAKSTKTVSGQYTVYDPGQ